MKFPYARVTHAFGFPRLSGLIISHLTSRYREVKKKGHAEASSETYPWLRHERPGRAGELCVLSHRSGCIFPQSKQKSFYTSPHLFLSTVEARLSLTLRRVMSDDAFSLKVKVEARVCSRTGKTMSRIPGNPSAADGRLRKK